MARLRCPPQAPAIYLSIISVGFLAALRPAKADGVERVSVPLVVDISRAGPVISPLLFGANLEHTRYAIWKGLSAQLLANRSFAATSVERSDGPRQVERGRPRAWPPTGTASESRRSQFALDTAEVYTGKQSQRIRVPVRGASGGIGQRDIAVQAGREYEVRLQLKADCSLTVAAGLCDGSGQRQYGRQSLRLEKGGWQTWRFTWKAPQTDLQARLEIVFEGPASLWIGAASLAPSDSFHGMRRDVIARLKEIGLPLRALARRSLHA